MVAREGEADLGYARTLEALASVERDELAGQPGGGGVAVFDAAVVRVQDECVTGRLDDRVDEVAGARVEPPHRLDRVGDQPTLNRTAVGVLEVGGEERRILPAVGKHKQFAARADLRSEPRLGEAGTSW